MAAHSSTLAWKIPWAEEPGGLQSMGSRRVRHDWATSLSLFTFIHWRRKWQPAPVFLPGESQGRGSLVGCRLWGRSESDTTEVTQQQQQHCYLYYVERFKLWSISYCIWSFIKLICGYGLCSWRGSHYQWWWRSNGKLFFHFLWKHIEFNWILGASTGETILLL